MEQILLYIVTISGFSGFMLGLYSLLVPVLQRRGFGLPFGKRSGVDADAYEDGFVEDADARGFAATSFDARRSSLLERLPPQTHQEDDGDGLDGEDSEDEDELLGDLDLSREQAELEAEDGEAETDEDAPPDAFQIEARDASVDLDEEDDLEDGDDDEADGDEEDEEEDEVEAAEPGPPVVHVVSGGGNDDMLALFEEGSEFTKEVEAWRADLPDPTITELLAEARELSAMLQGRRPRA